MYACYAFGYRRISPLFSIHGYRHITRPVELNPWLDGIGRGTFPNALNKIRRAIEFSKAPTYLDLDRGRDWSAARSALPKQPRGGVTPRATILTSSSVDLSALADESVDLILTDPPYFDNLSYSELSDFYLCWHQAIGIAEPPYDDCSRHAPMQENLAITNRSDKSVTDYARTLTQILRECQRVLRSDGLCVFTYHHNALRAWYALARALVSSGLRTTAVVPSRGEGQGGLHSYEGTIKWDAVLVCRRGNPATNRDDQPLVVSQSEVLRAADSAAFYAARFSRSTRIGFRSPDQLNLFRAIVVSHARFGFPSERFMSLEDALQREPSS
jgi:adenine-specific DNA methylase